MGEETVRFQFHSGSIKSEYAQDRTLQDVCSFNSIVVRLKVTKIESTPAINSGFNSIVVRLKGKIGRLMTIKSIRFNSIVVRLKARKTNA